MRKQRKQMLMVLFIVLIFGMSSLAFVVNFATPETKVTKLDTFVIDGEVNENLEYQYIQRGYTFMRYYYADTVPDYISQLPEIFVTNTNQKQLFVLKIAANDTYVSIRSANNEVSINATEEDIFDALCSTLMVTPSECGLRNILENITTNTTSATSGNETNTTNTTH
jgi:hypothetical protein